MFAGRYYILVLAALGLMLSACTRPEDSTAKISINFPQRLQSNKLGSMSASGDDLVHVSINITGGSYSTLATWDGHDKGPLTGPFSVDGIPMGESHLFQALAVYKNSVSHNMSFYYGDASKTVSGQEDVIIPISEIGQSQLVVGGQVAGRILETASTGPSGLVEIRYTPPGKPSMIVDKSSIINGWFSVFMLSGAPFDYVVAGGGPNLFGGPVSLDSAIFAPSSQVARVAIPVHVAPDYISGSSVPGLQDAEIDVWGYFNLPGVASSNVANKRICNDLGSGTFTALKVFNAVPANATSPLSFFTPSTISGFATNSQLLNTTTPLNMVNGMGGTAVAGSTCSPYNLSNTSDQFTNFMVVSKAAIDGHGHDGMAGFRNMFLSPINGSTLTFLPGSVSTAVSGKTLPGASAVYNGIKFFKKSIPSDFYIDNPVCDYIAGPSSGFVPAGEVTTIAVDGSFSGNLNVTSTDLAGGTIGVVACPEAGALLAPVGLFSQIYSGGPGPGGGGSPATKLAIVGLNPTPTAGLCTRFLAVAQDATNNPGIISSSTLVQFTTTNGTVYSDPSCSSVISGNYGFGGFNDFYFKPTSPTSASIDLTYVSGNSSTLTNSGAQAMTAAGALTITTLDFLAPFSTAQPLTCLPFHIIGRDSGNNEASLTSITGITLAASGSASPTLYVDPMCGKPTTFLMGGAFSILPMYLRAHNSGTVSVTASASTSGTGSLTIGASMAGSPSQASLMTPSMNASVGICTPIIAEVFDSMHFSAPVSPAQSVMFFMSGSCTGTPGAQFYTDSACTAAAGTNPTASIPAGESRAVLWMKSIASGPQPCSISATISPSSLSVAPIPSFTFN